MNSIKLLCCIALFISKSYAQPLVTVITSVYNGTEFIEQFMADITRQTLFNQCELIIINANSPGNEEAVILEYAQKYPNIIYSRLMHDPGLYAVWNMAIQQAHAPFITNANLDDRLEINSLAIHAQALLDHEDVDVVYADIIITSQPNVLFEQCHNGIVRKQPARLTESIYKCPPGNHPMWRKSLHERFGMFDARFKVAGDWEFWLRCYANGARFLKIPGVWGLYYNNPKGLSSDPASQYALPEWRQIAIRYAHLF